jgi:hypothetical protein
MDTEPKFTELTSYLEAEFPGFDLTRVEKSEFGTVLQLKSSDQVHILHVQHAFLEQTPTEDIRVTLAEFRLAPTLRDLGDFPIAVTVNGCIFGYA